MLKNYSNLPLINSNRSYRWGWWFMVVGWLCKLDVVLQFLSYTILYHSLGNSMLGLLIGMSATIKKASSLSFLLNQCCSKLIGKAFSHWKCCCFSQVRLAKVDTRTSPIRTFFWCSETVLANDLQIFRCFSSHAQRYALHVILLGVVRSRFAETK